MPRFSQFARAKGRFFYWHAAIACLAILSLNTYLVSRFHLPLSGTATVQSNSAKVQHMDHDASRWVPPIWSLLAPLSPALMRPPMREKHGYLPPQVHRLCDRSPPEFM